ncbi:MAG: DUF871 domain-containing protein [Clostridium sp.]|uniref:DUF871 domain-containing protein n=1 Tax=Clostridium sp. TaxID=1506 RepID=UPI0025C21067|nr:MupG family TIM beta-alpha barrel fold protein [Clostridium sp.]MBS4957249.1 DUF871 domain-containing protein [Clostridium sp.]
MTRLGISIYPEHSTKEKDIEYIRLAGKYGFKRVFTCLLSIGKKTKSELIEEFRELIDVAHEEGMEVILDVNPNVFKELNVSYDNLSLFNEIHADGIRLDEGFDGVKESLMTYNDNGLKIELNASSGRGYLDNVMSNFPNKDRIITCHNFYPQRFTGLSLEHFNNCNEAMKEYDLHTAAFVSSNNENTFGPWPVKEGLCTLEMHRDLPIDLQVRHLYATRMVDDIIIGNAYASEEELKSCSDIKPGILTFGIELDKELASVEHEILYYKQNHANRGDVSEYMARSSNPRVTFANESIPKANTVDMKRGDVVILNDEYSRYKGELHIVLKDMPNDGRKNVIGHIPEEELFLLDYMEPRKIFTFKKDFK